MRTKVSADVCDLCFFVVVGALQPLMIGSAIASGIAGHYWYAGFYASAAIAVIAIAICVAWTLVRIGKLDDQLAEMALEDARSEAAAEARAAMRNAIEAAMDDDDDA